MAGPMYRETKTVTATINSGAATSNVINLGGYALAGLVVPVLTSARVVLAVTGALYGVTPIYDHQAAVKSIDTPGGTGGVAIGSDSLAFMAGFNDRLLVSAAAAQGSARQFVFCLKG